MNQTYYLIKENQNPILQYLNSKQITQIIRNLDKLP
jgi:hypothetical protein